MRIHLKTSKTGKIIPFNYQTYLTGALHKWIGKNNLHDDRLSLYSFSWLNGGLTTEQGLKFENGANLFISAYNEQLLKRIIHGIRESPDIAFGLEVKEVIIQENPLFETQVKFNAASPILIKRNINGKIKHYTYHDQESSDFLTETLKNKLRKENIDDKGVNVQFDLSYNNPKTKIIYYNKIGNKVNICPVVIEGTPEQILFAWNVGLGNSTGIGFGALE